MRITPRQKGSNWSKINVKHVECLMAEGNMQPSGMAHVEAAQADGRWQAAYVGSSAMTIPTDFLNELEKTPNAKIAFSALNRSDLFAIYLGLQTAKNSEIRNRRMTKIILKLAQHK